MRGVMRVRIDRHSANGFACRCRDASARETPAVMAPRLAGEHLHPLGGTDKDESAVAFVSEAGTMNIATANEVINWEWIIKTARWQTEMEMKINAIGIEPKSEAARTQTKAATTKIAAAKPGKHRTFQRQTPNGDKLSWSCFYCARPGHAWRRCRERPPGWHPGMPPRASQ